jgi:crotonobetainyl-CoA:carnitine CoA-transferase CaiB-like acyl-CoA transferase
MGAFALTSLWPLARTQPSEALRSIGNGHPLHAPFGDYACADGRLMLTVTTDAQWRGLAPLVSLDAGWDRAARKSHAERIDAALARWLAARPAMEAAQTLQKLGVPAAPILDLAQVAQSSQIEARAMVCEVEHPAYGKVPLINTPLAGATPRSGPWRMQPELGQHNEDVIGGLLGRGAELESLRAEKVIA